jgi:hypothetical protein
VAELVSALILVATCLVIGVRLLILAARTHELPELLMGISFVLAGAVASVLDVARQLSAESPGLERPLAQASLATLHLGIGCVALFTWRVFRPRDALGWALAALCLSGLALGGAGEATGPFLRPGDAPHVWFWISLASRIATYGWAGVESFAYWVLLRRRERLGLADPLVANRLLLWVIATATILVVWVRLLVLAATGFVGAQTNAFTTALVVLCAAAIWLAFFPPEAWRRRFERPGEATASA